MGWFSSLSKGLKKAFSGSSGVLGSLTGGLSTAFTGGNVADVVDPGNIFHEGAAQREANRQWELEYDLSKKNYESQEYWNNLNYQQQLEAFNYQKELNATQMEREDTAVQRRVADLKAAGLSPTLAAGSAASSTPVHAGSAPQGEAPQQMAPSDIKAREAMFREQKQKDYLQLASTLLSNYADISRTKAETEFIKSQKGYQDIVNKYAEQTILNKIKAQELDNVSKNMANSFNQLANPARLKEMQTRLSMLDKELKILGWDEKIKTNEALRQIYYNNKARFEADLAGQNVEIAKLRRENIDYDTACKAYSLVYAVEHGVPLSGFNQWQAIYNIADMIKKWFFPDNPMPSYIKPGATSAVPLWENLFSE